jgi:hypothetical protein
VTIIAFKDQGFTAATVVTKRTNGSLVTPDAGPLCEFYRVDPTTGAMAKDLAMGTNGRVTMTLVPGTSFMYSAAIDLAPADFDLYSLSITYSYDSSAGTNSERIHLMVSRPDMIIYRSRNVTIASQGTTFRAPTPDEFLPGGGGSQPAP